MTSRRRFLMAAVAATAGITSARTVRAQDRVSRITAYGFSFPALKDGDIRLADFAGHPLLVVNTASLCGFTAIQRPSDVVERIP